MTYHEKGHTDVLFTLNLIVQKCFIFVIDLSRAVYHDLLLIAKAAFY